MGFRHHAEQLQLRMNSLFVDNLSNVGFLACIVLFFCLFQVCPMKVIIKFAQHSNDSAWQQSQIRCQNATNHKKNKVLVSEDHI